MNTSAFPTPVIGSETQDVSRIDQILDSFFDVGIQLGQQFLESKIKTGNQVTSAQPTFKDTRPRNKPSNQPTLTTNEFNGGSGVFSINKNTLILVGAGIAVAVILVNQG